MTRRDRERKAARQTAFLEPRRRLLVVCEGAVTELQYFEAFQRWCRNPRVEVCTHGPAGVPFPLVSVAKELKQEAERRAKAQGDENLGYDEVWCVFDVDEHPRISEARQMATDNGLELAMSSPCFELWLLLHLRENPGAQHRHKIQSMLEELMPGVEKKYIDFERLIGGYDEACRRAERLAREAVESGEPWRNPMTEVHRLTDSIDEAGAIRRAKPVRPDPGRAKAEAAAAAALEQAAREIVEEGSFEE